MLLNNPPIRFPSISKLWFRRNFDLEEKYWRDVFLQRFMLESCIIEFIAILVLRYNYIDKFILDNINLKAVSYFPYTMMCLNNPCRSYYKVVQALNRYCIEVGTCRQTNTVSGVTCRMKPESS